MIQETFEMNSKDGLHAPYVSQLVQVASRFNSDIFLTHNGRTVNLKSMIGVLSLGIPKQAIITLEASGQDEKRAINQVLETLKTMFNKEAK